MRRKSGANQAPGCTHPVLGAFANAFVDEWSGADPVDDARILGAVARRWTPEKRRRALAARIALLALEGGRLAAPRPEEASTDAAEDAADPGDMAEAAGDPVPIDATDFGRAARRTPPPATIGAASAAGLLAEMASSDHDKRDRVPTDSRADSGRLDLRNTGPLDRAGRGNSDEIEWTSDPRKTTDSGQYAPLEARMRDVDDSLGPVAKKHTMTDLSLAILTGEFSGGSSVSEETEAAQEEASDATVNSEPVGALEGEPAPAPDEIMQAPEKQPLQDPAAEP